MGRQLFLHHYLPAHLASALVTGALIEFVFNIESPSLEELENGTATMSADGGKGKGSANEVKAGSQRSKPVRERIATQSLLATWAATGVILAVVIWAFLFYAPLTYGKPGLTVPQVKARQWLNYDLHFAK